MCCAFEGSTTILLIPRPRKASPEVVHEYVPLLTHASGLPRESDYPYWSPPDFRFPTHEQIVARIVSQPALYSPETNFQYSNLGLTLAGEVVAATSGMPYDRYVRSNILQPLGLSSTTPEMPESERGKRLATGYFQLIFHHSSQANNLRA